MHELSIAMGIVDLATEHARKGNASRVVEVELDIGTVSGVEIQALEFAMEVAVKDTLLEDARIRINRIEAVSECLECGHRFNPDRFMIRCPGCGALTIKVVSGTEMQVKSLLVE